MIRSSASVDIRALVAACPALRVLDVAANASRDKRQVKHVVFALRH